MIQLKINYMNHSAKLTVPAEYERVVLALWSIGLDHDPEKYTLRRLGAEFSFTTEEESHYVIMKSNADMPVSIQANAIARDSNGVAIGADSVVIDILGAGETSIGYFYFGDVTGVASVEYQLFYDTDPYYTPVLGDLSVECTPNPNNVIVAVTNNGTKPALFVEAYALFFDAQNNVVYAESGYVVDDDSEIKPGKMLVEQLDTYKNYDHCEVYLTGRAD